MNQNQKDNVPKLSKSYLQRQIQQIEQQLADSNHEKRSKNYEKRSKEDIEVLKEDLIIYKREFLKRHPAVSTIHTNLYMDAFDAYQTNSNGSIQIQDIIHGTKL